MARKKKSKYKKQFIEVWKCRGCDFQWSYKTCRCPLCSTTEMLKLI
ncbi:MAG: hypothetical protein QMD85_03350 [Candidatus Aenigmarchaeota archaeon]|nr:hypothetical protein [Candidatus Aenigmarchaeota archaeon]MDI6722579.1 hypothetical protein [Candidatus Aenigmarchaeota archaeon]